MGYNATEPAMKPFNDLLNEHIEAVGISDSELARAIGVSRQTIFRWREGHTARPRRREDVVALAQKLRLTPEERDVLLLAAGFAPHRPAEAPDYLAALTDQNSYKGRREQIPWPRFLVLGMLAAALGLVIWLWPRDPGTVPAVDVAESRTPSAVGGPTAGPTAKTGGASGTDLPREGPTEITGSPGPMATPLRATGPGEAVVLLVPLAEGSAMDHLSGRLAQALEREAYTNRLEDIRVVETAAAGAHEEAVALGDQAGATLVVESWAEGTGFGARLAAPPRMDASHRSWLAQSLDEALEDMTLRPGDALPQEVRSLALLALAEVALHRGEEDRALALLGQCYTTLGDGGLAEEVQWGVVPAALCLGHAVADRPEQAGPYCEAGAGNHPLAQAGQAVAYALNGELEEAARMLEGYNAWLREKGAGGEDQAQRCERWLGSLTSGDNPFTPDVLASLRGENQP